VQGGTRDPFRIASEVLAGRPTRWQNLGLWHGTEDYETACEALAALVGEAADLHCGDRVAELGCGSGAALPVWRERFGVGEIVGIELDPGRARRAGAFGRVVTGPAIVQARGSVPRLGLEGLYSAIVIVDAAYHLGSARDLATACLEALAPRGRLAFTTLTAPGRIGAGPVAKAMGRIAAIPEGALIGPDAWKKTLAEAGFHVPRVESCDEVLSGYALVSARKP
jgi:SAM-dependent methyltransferase